jgi:hypothetical protein
MAASVGLEPTTSRLTAVRSAIELRGNEVPQVSIELTTSGFSDQRSYQTELPGENKEERWAITQWTGLIQHVESATPPSLPCNECGRI